MEMYKCANCNKLCDHLHFENMMTCYFVVVLVGMPIGKTKISL